MGRVKVRIHGKKAGLGHSNISRRHHGKRNGGREARFDPCAETRREARQRPKASIPTRSAHDHQFSSSSGTTMSTSVGGESYPGGSLSISQLLYAAARKLRDSTFGGRCV
jgi:hypothetical protein